MKDKLKITEKLDGFGVDYIEAGNPGSNPKDAEFFKEVKRLRLNNSRLVAFGSTRRAGMRAAEDANVNALLQAETPAVAVFGKSWDLHVKRILRTTMEENLEMIRDTIAYLKKMGKEVIFDAEHFFDGYKANPGYAEEVLSAAAGAGADWLALCDTNGGTMTHELSGIVGAVAERFRLPVGIHCHDDSGMAVANTVAAVINGATQVQGTINGYGERCGNANLCTVIPNLQLKQGLRLMPDSALRELTPLSRHISELVNQAHNENAPYVGNNAFAHKGGMHIDAVLKDSVSFEHIAPEAVGNRRQILMSEVAGRSAVVNRIKEAVPWIVGSPAEMQSITDMLKKLEHEGYQFEGAEGSFELLARRSLCESKEFFKVLDFSVICDEKWSEHNNASAMIKVEVAGKEEITAAQGDGPVNAMDKALRRALELFYPQLKNIRLTDYKVRVLDTKLATASKVRVHIESTDGSKVWGTVGVSTNIIEASWNALVDSIEYYLLHENELDGREGKERESVGAL